jgi:pilus assembly protein FimV
MGDASSGYWDRVQIMGYELAPSNPLFSDAKDSGLSAADLEITKPQEADFDLGASEDDDTNFSTTDFNLGEEDTGGNFTDTASMGEAGLIAATQQIPQLDDLPDFELDDDDTDLRSESEPETVAEVELDADLELPDDIGEELEFSMDEDDSGDTDEAELSDDLAMDFDIDDDAVELDAAAFGATEVIPSIASKDDDDEDEIDLGMEDTAMIDIDETSLATGELNLDTAEVNLPGIEDDLDDDNEDISIIDFGGEDFVEPTDIIESIADEDDSIMMDVDIDEGDETKTGTFAPGDFEEPTAAVDSLSDIDDIGDLMLPDDVDEVSTKLDLARAFIDMGDTEGARGSLEEVLSEGNDEQKAEAKTLLDQI